MDTSEARYAEVAREMAVDGHWLVPHLSGHPHLTKPPLAYWLVAASITVFGPAEWAARLPVGIAAVFVTLVTALLARAMFGERAGLWAAWAQGLAIVPLGAANVITTDMLLTLCETAFMWCAWELMTARDVASARRWELGFGVALGAAALTKGPAGFVPLVGLLIFVFLARQRVAWRRLLSLRALVVFALLALPWPAAVLFLVPNAPAIWREEIITNVVQEADHDFPRYAYLLMLAFGSFPACIGVAMELLRWRHKDELSPQHRLGHLYLLSWFFVSLVILSAQKTRLPLYILPLYPPLSVLGGLGFSRFLSGSRLDAWRPRLVAGLALYALVCLAGKWYYSATVQTRDSRRCFKQVAEIVRSALSSPSTKPILYIREGRLGYGLMYYLNTPDLVRIDGKPSEGNRKATASMAQILASPVPAGRDEFFIIEPKKEDKLQLLSQAAVKVGENQSYAVWKRTSKPSP